MAKKPDDPRLKTVGWGLIPLPGEKRTCRKAAKEAQDLIKTAKVISRRSAADKQ